MTELDLNAMPAVTKAPARVKTDPEAAGTARRPLREEADRSIRDVPRAPTGLVRQRNAETNQFDLPPQILSRYAEAGWSLEWKTHTVFGQEDWGYSNALSENGWEPVTTDEIPGYMPPGYTGAIIRDGLMLMKRPAYLTQEAIQENNRAALSQVQSQEAKLAEAPSGTLTRAHPKLPVGVGRSFERMDVADD